MDKFECERCKTVTEYSKEESPDFFVCPECGSKIHFMTLTAEQPILASMKGIAYSISKTKYFLKFEQIYEVFKASNKMRYIQRLYDKKNNIYKKTYTDVQTGEIVVDEEGPLKDHQGFGDAKHKNDKN